VQLAVLLSCSRAALVLVCLRGVPAARPDGLGAAVAGSVPPVATVAVWLGVAAVLTAASVAAGDSWVTGPVATLLALAAVGLLLRRCIRRLGGVTGDVMGACIEVACTALAVGSVLQWS
jgi:adenosylcobinamide-GDP ribazoletransferase